ncbi:MAG: division/cell wall cluster transcriptional repressor MraZ [Rickettsiales bacterium]|jgi:MraZ protein|nr:division/cell wall cluster transcriptional repressor MraZ [Rickettsiales bacterium]
MSLFLSSFTNHIDTKGRLSVPATFRAALNGDAFAGVVLFRSFTNKCIEGFSMSRMEKMADATDNLGAFDKTQDDLTAMLFADARPLNFDVSGRVVIPEDLLKHADITDEAVFVGRGKSFQIWNPTEFAQTQTSALTRLQSSHPTLKL